MKRELKASLRHLSKENRKTVIRMRRYLRARFLNPVCCEELVSDLVGMAIESEQRGVPFSETVGMDYEQFCHELAANIPRQTFTEIIWGVLGWVFGGVGVIIPLLFIYSLLVPQYSPVRCAGLLATLPVAWVLKYLYVVLAFIFAYYLIRRLSYHNIPIVFAVYLILALVLFIIADNLLLPWVGKASITLHVVVWFSVFALLACFAFSMRYYAALLIAYRKRAWKAIRGLHGDSNDKDDDGIEIDREIKDKENKG